MSIKKLEKYLFRPLVMNGQKLVMIYGYNVNQSKTVGGDLNLTNKVSYHVDLIHITDSIEEGDVLIETAEITDINQFYKVFIIPEEDQFNQDLAISCNMVEREIAYLLEQSGKYIKAANAIKSILHKIEKKQEDPNKDVEENIIIATPTGGLAHIVYSTIGEKYQLKETDLNKIGNVIRDIVVNHEDIDLEDKEAIDKMQAEIEYKIIEVMPIQLKTGDIHINMDFILNEIASIRDDGDNDVEL